MDLRAGRMRWSIPWNSPGEHWGCLETQIRVVQTTLFTAYKNHVLKNLKKEDETVVSASLLSTAPSGWMAQCLLPFPEGQVMGKPCAQVLLRAAAPAERCKSCCSSVLSLVQSCQLSEGEAIPITKSHWVVFLTNSERRISGLLGTHKKNNTCTPRQRPGKSYYVGPAACANYVYIYLSHLHVRASRTPQKNINVFREGRFCKMNNPYR